MIFLIYGATGDEKTNVLHGKWENKTKEVQLKEILPGGGLREFHGHLEDLIKKTQSEDGTETEEKLTLIKGTWIWGERRGKFACCKEKDSNSSILRSIYIV